LPGERNQQSAAEEFAPSPQGESVLDASMMAELIVTKKEIVPQLKKSTGISRVRTKSPGAGGQRLQSAGRHGAEHSMLWSLSFRALFAAGFAVSVRTPVEGRSGRTRRRGHTGHSRPFVKSEARESARGLVPLASLHETLQTNSAAPPGTEMAGCLDAASLFESMNQG
jgi:hypothetical protein